MEPIRERVVIQELHDAAGMELVFIDHLLYVKLDPSSPPAPTYENTQEVGARHRDSWVILSGEDLYRVNHVAWAAGLRDERSFQKQDAERNEDAPLGAGFHDPLPDEDIPFGRTDVLDPSDPMNVAREVIRRASVEQPDESLRKGFWAANAELRITHGEDCSFGRHDECQGGPGGRPCLCSCHGDPYGR